MVLQLPLPEGARPHAIQSSAEADVGGRCGDEAQQLVRQLVRLRGRRAPTASRAAAAQGWARRWWSLLAIAVQRAVCSAVLGTWSMPAIPADVDSIPLAGVLDLADAALPSRLPRALDSARQEWCAEWSRKTCNMPLPARPRAHGGPAAPGGDAHVPTMSECKTFQAAGVHPLMETQASQSALRLPPRAQADAWLSLDDVDLQEELRHPVPTLQDVPPFLRAAVRGALVQALERLRAERSEGAATGTRQFEGLETLHTGAADAAGAHGATRPAGPSRTLGDERPHSSAASGLQLLQSARPVCDPARDAPALPPDEVCERKRRPGMR